MIYDNTKHIQFSRISQIFYFNFIESISTKDIDAHDQVRFAITHLFSCNTKTRQERRKFFLSCLVFVSQLNVCDVKDLSK